MICDIASPSPALPLWHQEKADVQALLPVLATYLGHARYSDTAYYVTGTAELFGMAAERAFAVGVSHERALGPFRRYWNPSSAIA